MIRFKGITWSNPRGYFPLKAASIQYTSLFPDVQFTWDVRSLKDFADVPIERLAAEYDFILMDHPHTGVSAKKGLILPLDEWVPADFLEDQSLNSVGASHSSYQWEGRQWAFAVDAAAQVTAYRPDLFQKHELQLPRSWDDVFALARTLPPGLHIGIPLVPTDTVCCLLSICANLGGRGFWSESDGIGSAGEEAVALLQKLLPYLHPKSLQMNPIAMLDYMSNMDEIAYIPLTFGYSNYSRRGFVSNPIYFTDIPSHPKEPEGALLGGVGLAVSAACRNKSEAAAFAQYVASGDVQKGCYFDSGGQPGHRSAWMCEEVNVEANGFFINTLQTLDLSYLRPRHPGYNEFQEIACEFLHQALMAADPPKEVIQGLNRLYRQTKANSNAR